MQWEREKSFEVVCVSTSGDADGTEPLSLLPAFGTGSFNSAHERGSQHRLQKV